MFTLIAHKLYSEKVLDSPFEVAALSSIAKPKGLKQAFLQRRL
jgi:hypothetical protein